MLLVDDAGVIRDSNTRLRQLLGYSRAEVCGAPISQLIPEGLPNPTLHPAQADRSCQCENHLNVDESQVAITKAGDEIPVELAVSAVTPEDDHLFIASITDVTARLQESRVLTEQSARLQAIVGTAVESIIVIDDSGVIESANPATEQLFGYCEAELLGQNVRMLMPTPDRERHDGYLSHFLATGERKIIGIGRETAGLHKNGQQFPMELAVSEMLIGQRRKFTGIIRDISARRDAETALKNQVKETSEALTRLRETQDQLVQSERLASLGGLVAGIAHEINTPVGIGVTAASYLKDEIERIHRLAAEGGLGKRAFSEFLDNCVDSSDILLTNLARAADLISSFKQVAVDQSHDQRRRIILADYIHEILVSLKPQLKTGGHTVHVECPPDLALETMPGALSQVLTNLVMNSLTHAFSRNEAGQMNICVQCDGDQMRMSYSDNGCGIPADVLPKIFDPFFTTRRGRGGSGLGLHLVFCLVHQNLGGTISAASDPGLGTRFDITLPVSLSQN